MPGGGGAGGPIPPGGGGGGGGAAPGGGGGGGTAAGGGAGGPLPDSREPETRPEITRYSQNCKNSFFKYIELSNYLFKSSNSLKHN